MCSLAREPRAVQLSVFKFLKVKKKKKKIKTQQNQKKDRNNLQESSDKRNGLQRRARDFATFWEVNRRRRGIKVVTQAAAL